MDTFIVIMFYFVVIAGPISFIFIVVAIERNVRKDFDFIVQVLDTPVKKNSFLSDKAVEGFYKGRKILVSYCFGLGGGSPSLLGGKSRTIWISIMPLMPLQGHKLVWALYPRPTCNTYFMNDNIFYNNVPAGFEYKGLSVSGTDAEIRNIFDELTKAAEVVEAKAPFYRDGK
jgi:hypothetical protein